MNLVFADIDMFFGELESLIISVLEPERFVLNYYDQGVEFIVWKKKQAQSQEFLFN